MLPPYEIVERAGVRVGFIGVTTVDASHFLLSEHARDYRWLDLSGSVNRWVPELRRRGEAIVVVAHAGAFQEGAAAAVGEIVDEAGQMDDAVNVIVAGHQVHAYEHPVWRLRTRGADLPAAMAEQPGLVVSGRRGLDAGAVYTVPANGIVAERAPFERADRRPVGTDLEALVTWLGRES